MLRILLLLSITVITHNLTAQKIKLNQANQKIRRGLTPTAEDAGFKSYRIMTRTDTINFYTYQKPGATPNSVYMELPGTNAQAIYTWHKDTDSTYWFNSLTRFDFSFMPDNFLFVIVAKPGFEFFGDPDKFPTTYWKKTSLHDRVMRADAALRYIQKNVLKNPQRTVVFGYSEGFYVAAKLATVNKSITHLGIGGGGGYIDFYDFVLDNLKSYTAEQMVADSVVNKNKRIIATLKEIMADPESTRMTGGYTVKRWASFAEPPLESLVKLNIPIYQVHGIDDESTPVESAYLVPVEFARLRKNNLTFKVYPTDHSLREYRTDGTEVEHWDNMMRDFFKWVMK
jgi:pimeloyl-ACP methyl ester carboxylesterase